MNITDNNLLFDIDNIIEKSKKDNYTFIDITKLHLKNIPDFTKHKNYHLIKNIKYLFASNNDLETIEKKDLEQFPNLTVIDLSFNNIITINYLPQSLDQLSVNDNQLKSIPYLKNLTLLEASNNKLVSLEKYENLKSLLVDSNELTEIKTYPKIEYITCRNNNITKIFTQPELIHLNCSNNHLINIESMPNLLHLICHNNENLCNFDDSIRKLITFEFINTKINYLPYMKSLKHIVCTYIVSKNNIILSEEYKIKEYIKGHTKNNIDIEFE
jgi:Leucine-rich repeat (LRR) protein